ncbi:hypothetical protein Tco_1220131 [Tanacetum coccineum]
MSSTNEVVHASGDFGIDEEDLKNLILMEGLGWGFFKVRNSFKKTGGHDFKENDLFLLINQKLSAITITEKGTLLGNADLEGIKGEDLMVTVGSRITLHFISYNTNRRRKEKKK